MRISCPFHTISQFTSSICFAGIEDFSPHVDFIKQKLNVFKENWDYKPTFVGDIFAITYPETADDKRSFGGFITRLLKYDPSFCMETRRMMRQGKRGLFILSTESVKATSAPKTAVAESSESVDEPHKETGGSQVKAIWR